MVNSLINPQEWSKRLGRIFQQIIQEVEQVRGTFPVTGAEYNRDNLLAYLALRKHNISDFQHSLADQGLAALEQSYCHVLYTLEKILGHLQVGVDLPATLAIPTPSDSRRIMNNQSSELLGKGNNQLHSTIMVTLDAKMATNQPLISELLLKGMNIARINCAHDDHEVWKQLIEGVRLAENRLRETGHYHDKKCKIYMDLAGPKVRIGKLPSEDILVKNGESLRLLLESDKLGHPASTDAPAGVPVTLEKAFRNVRINDRIFIDDGKISGIVRYVTEEYIEIEVQSPVGKPYRIKEGKGLNLPDSLLSLNVPALTEKDISDLSFITKYADILGVSFVHSPLDLKKLRVELSKYEVPHLGVVAKIETKDAVHHLARIILDGLHFERFGIMIARGDLAVEVGSENLSFVQEEVLAICSAAYVPVILATGVLERITKKGIPSRSEMTDVFFARRANCIMLNKGTYILNALDMLTKVLIIDEANRLTSNESKRNLTAQYGVLR
ncbi:pyruvate kinase [Neobacillus rhizosphaerae]|uniref:pyruvate kinase n=1 Tax=Neobacillus rhizosphaerae TaxID=2880965 RepID=UPI003D295C1C